VGGRDVRANLAVHAGDRVVVDLPEPVATSVQPEATPLENPSRGCGTSSSSTSRQEWSFTQVRVIRRERSSTLSCTTSRISAESAANCDPASCIGSIRGTSGVIVVAEK
jgi:hypothetical protein